MERNEIKAYKYTNLSGITLWRMSYTPITIKSEKRKAYKTTKNKYESGENKSVGKK